MTAQLSLDEAAVAPEVGAWHANDPDTSRQAAIDQWGRTATQKRAALLALAAAPDGLTDYELHLAIGTVRPHVAGTRRGSLVALGLVAATDRRRPTDTGRLAVVWEATTVGRQLATQLRQESGQ